MNIYYFISVVIGRISNLIALIIFSFVLNPKDFGTYSAISTNALFLYLIFGAWIPNYAWKEMSKTDIDKSSQSINEIRRFIVIVSVWQIVFCTLVFWFIQKGVNGYWIGAIAIWSVATLLFDTTLVIKNAQGESREYATLTFARGLLGLLLASVLLLVGLGLWGAVFGTILGIFGSLILVRSSWVIWINFDSRSKANFSIIAPLKFGVSSVLALNIYMLVNAVSRNIILIDLGAESAGYASLSSDLFYAPVALFVTSISLSKIPTLYREASAENPPDSDSASSLLSDSMAVILPYIVGGMFTAESVAKTVLSAQTMQNISAIAQLSAIQGGVLALLSTQTTIALTKGRVKTAVMIAIITIVLVGLAHLLVVRYHSLYHYSLIFTIAVSAVAALSVLFSKQLLGVPVQVNEVFKITIAAVAMALSLAALKLLNLPLSPFPEILVGGSTFILSAYALSSQSVNRIIKVTSK
jgi:O-antigen/teichoic acid export membrane protein